MSRAYTPKPPRPEGLIAIDRANLRALLRHLYREHGSWVRVARAVSYRRAVVVAFSRDEHEGNTTLARGIAKACGLSYEDAIAGIAPKKARAA
jgi:hypothetical protein